MNATPYAHLLIRQFEGLRLEPYKCPAGVWTIGYGHTTNTVNVQPITQYQAEQLLHQDIQQVETYLNSLNLSLTQNQFDALTSLVFNIGQQAFTKSTLLKLIRQNPNNPDIPAQFQRWIYAAGRPQPGLIKRRQEESKLYQL